MRSKRIRRTTTIPSEITGEVGGGRRRAAQVMKGGGAVAITGDVEVGYGVRGILANLMACSASMFASWSSDGRRLEAVAMVFLRRAIRGWFGDLRKGKVA